jgi:hypothetical protein
LTPTHTVAIMSNMSYNILGFGTGAEIGIAELRTLSSSTKLRDLFAESPLVRVARYRAETDAWIVDPDLMHEFMSSRDELREMRKALPLFVAAIRAGVRIPSETLEAIGISTGDASWRAINEFQADHDIEIGADEDGNALPSIHIRAQAAQELDEELVLLVD